MVSSNGKFGGNLPQLSKGGINRGETPLEGALREANEELGLKFTNLKSKPFLLFKDKVKGLKISYQMHVYAAEIKNPKDFGKFHYETKKTIWVADDKIHSIRKSQQHIFKKLIEKINK